MVCELALRCVLEHQGDTTGYGDCAQIDEKDDDPPTF